MVSLERKVDDPFQDEGLVTPNVQPYAQKKHKLVAHYASLFLRTMRGKWNALIYLDLFAGAGKAKVKRTSRIIDASPLVVLKLDDKFNTYIFCDNNPENCITLQKRAVLVAPSCDIRVLNCDINKYTDMIIQEMPVPHRRFTVLGFCFLDPFKMANMEFTTIQRIASRFVDFLILLPSGMDANRNEPHYTQDGNIVVERFLGDPLWRGSWLRHRAKGMNFGNFIVHEFCNAMRGIGYHCPELCDTVPVMNEKNAVIYRLSLFSKNTLGMKFWKESIKGTNPQRNLFD